MIDRFDGDNAFLSNFFPCRVWMDGVFWLSAEHAYQASKTKIFGEKLAVFQCDSPHAAKKAGRRVTIRSDWEQVKVLQMHSVVLAKFEANPLLREGLFKTGDEELIEGNHWGDTFWGVCNGVGQNMLGIVLMDVRRQLRAFHGAAG